MAYTTINKSSDYFNTKLYTGNGSNGHAITGVGFQPDWLWIKSRSDTKNHNLWDAVRGNTKRLISNTNGAESTETSVTSFDSDGFTLDSGTTSNGNSLNFVSWNWKANGTGSANTDGNVNTTVSANATAGFSIVKYTGNGSATATFGHGLNAVPKMIIVKKINVSNDWLVYHEAITYANRLKLNSTAAQESSPNWRATPTSSVFNSNASNIINNTGDSYIAYVFANVTGYSKFGSYVGNGNADGTFVYTGFKPAFIMYKKSSGTGRWTMEDNKRDPFNVATHGLAANGSSAENTGSNYWDVDLLSNGFKFRTTEQETNQSGQTFIYMAFGAAPLVGSNGVTAKAR